MVISIVEAKAVKIRIKAVQTPLTRVEYGPKQPQRQDNCHPVSEPVIDQAEIARKIGKHGQYCERGVIKAHLVHQAHDLFQYIQ